MKGLGVDHWQHVSKFLRPKDLCRLMCVSRSFRSMWGSDRFWYHQELRVCSRFPELKSVFEKYRALKPVAKKTRTETLLEIPKGIWYVFKTVLHRAGTNEGLIEFGKIPDIHPVVYAVVLVSIPNNEKIVEKKIRKAKKLETGSIDIVTSSMTISFCIESINDVLFVDYIWDRKTECLLHHALVNGDYGLNFYVTWQAFLFDESFSCPSVEMFIN